jgi:L-galactose dehydrogenase
MDYRPLGRTGLTVSVLGYGASPLGGVYGRVDVAEAVRSVHAALDLGVNFIDVAPFYGATQAEAVLGQALHRVDRDRYVLATKVGRYGDDDFDFSAQRIVRSVDDSLVRLGTEYIDVIQCHDIEFVDPRQIVEEALPALERLRIAGKIRFIGVTGYPLEALAAVAGQVHLDTVLSYCRYTLLDRALLRWAPRFHALGTAVINASPFAMGLLAGTEAPGWHPAPASLRDAARGVTELCHRRGVDVAKVALQFAVRPEQFATTVVGSETVAKVSRNVDWLAQPVDGALLGEIETLIGPQLNTTWTTGPPHS